METANLMDILQSISVIFAAVSVMLGVSAWRREHVGKRRIELAEDVLTAFYEARDAIRRIRDPWSNKDEGKSRMRGPGEGIDESEFLDRAHIPRERYNKESDHFNRLRSMRYRMVARFSVKAEKPFDDLDKIVREIFIAAFLLGNRYWPRQGRVEMTEGEHRKHLKEMEAQELIFWAAHGDKDPIEKRLSELILEVESICRPAVQEDAGFSRILTRWI